MPKRQKQSRKKNSAPAKKTKSKLSSGAQFTFFLLGIMFLIGAVTGGVGYFFGRNSLRGITQPDLNPFLNASTDPSEAPRQSLSFLKEEELIKKVQAQTRGSTAKPETPEKKDKDKPGQDEDDKKTEAKQPDVQKADGSFPIRLESGNVKMDIRSLVQKDDEIVLNVAMVNGSDNPVQFIYTFLDITDNKGYSLSSEVIGIPETLQAKSDTHVGTIRVLDTPPGAATRLSLSLTDYPDQKVNLKIKDIPVAKQE